MLGILSKNGKTKTEAIFSDRNIPNRSPFSCERYKFLLDAPFEVCNICCRVMKKSPTIDYRKRTGRVPITGQMASESRLRTQVWLKQGCNAFEGKKKMSNPMSFWTEQDVLYYLYKNRIPIASVYGEIIREEEIDGQYDWSDLGIFDLGRPILTTSGCQRTGCMSCLFGYHLEKRKENRICGIMRYSNPKIADWMLRGGRFNEEGLWQPYQGLGYWFLFEWCNKHGDMKYWYPNREHYLKTYMTEETKAYLK